MKPQQVSDALLAFPAEVEYLLPKESEIPKDFWDGNGWTAEAENLFFCGVFKTDRMLKSVIKKEFEEDVSNMPRHVQAILGTFSIRHEYKIAAVGYLLSLWIDPID